MKIKQEPKTYRVWHIPQVPGAAFHVQVDSLEKAILVREVLALYDMFQYVERIKPDYSNASGIEEPTTDPEDTEEWWEADEGDVEAQHEAMDTTFLDGYARDLSERMEIRDSALQQNGA